MTLSADIILEAIQVDRNRISYKYSVSENASRYFNKSTPFFIEYLDDAICFDGLPESILAIPFVMNLLPLCWIFDLSLSVPSVDKVFYESTFQIKKGFQDVYPDAAFSGQFSVASIVENAVPISDKSICLFSGGVDATYTLLRHRTEHPIIVNVWGVDIALDDYAGHEEVDRYCRRIASSENTEYICIKTTARSFYAEQLLNQEAFRAIGDYWWHGAQHSIGLVSLLAPIDYLLGIKTNYIASTFTQKEYDDGVKCVSYPQIDNALQIASTHTYHDGFDAKRIEKVRYICDIRKKENLDLDLKVCFHFVHGKNCCNCEKCYRTMMSILIYDKDIEKYGFHLQSAKAHEIRRFLMSNEVGTFRWLPIQSEYAKSGYANKSIAWLKRIKLNNLSSFSSRLIRLQRKLFK